MKSRAPPVTAFHSHARAWQLCRALVGCIPMHVHAANWTGHHAASTQVCRKWLRGSNGTQAERSGCSSLERTCTLHVYVHVHVYGGAGESIALRQRIGRLHNV